MDQSQHAKKVVSRGSVDVCAARACRAHGVCRCVQVRLACRERIAVGDFDRACQKRLQAGPDQPWPCPTGWWDGESFVLCDGRHEWLATVALGYEHLLVAWLEAAVATADLEC